MKWLLICPWDRPLVPHLGGNGTLATMPLLGQSLVEYWLGHLAYQGAKEVVILADEQPDLVRQVAGDGARWGISVRVIEESRELSSAQVLLKYERELDPTSLQNQIVCLDHLPGQPEIPLFEDYANFFKALLTFMPNARTPERVGVREIEPGIWAGLNCHVSADAQLQAPCWLGKNVFIGSKAMIGPNTIIEDGSFIDSMAAVSEGFVGADTYIGQCSEVVGSMAIGNMLIKISTGATIQIPDIFVMCGLRRPKATPTAGWLEKLSDLCVKNKGEASLLWKHFLMNRES